VNEEKVELIERSIQTKEDGPVWVYDVMEDTVKQVRTISKDSLTVDKLISIINSEYNSRIRLDFKSVSNDTIYVQIKDSEYFTQRMGTSGADEFMISSTFTLTELPNIKFVNFEFEFGDHATPGTYSRKHYLDWIKKNKSAT
jgi:hypothetical protein